MTTPLYMHPAAHAAEAIARAAQRAGESVNDVRLILRIMVSEGGAVRMNLAWLAWGDDGPLDAALLEGLVCCDHSSGVWRVTDLGRAGVGP